MANHRLFIAVLLAGIIAAPAYSQSSNPAEERARLANQRIQAEAQRRQQEEAEARQAAEQAAAEARTQTAAVSVPAASQQAPAATSASRPTPTRDYSGLLQQIRTLGELRDAGYLTESEFERIKARMLDGEL